MLSPVDSAPTLLFILGPPAVGKMAVGMEIARRTGFKVLHNHLTIDLALRFYEFGTPPFNALLSTLRAELIASLAASELPGVVVTFVVAFDEPTELDELAAYAEPFRTRGSLVHHLELSAMQNVRLQRNVTELRLAEKAPKRDLEWSREDLIGMDERHRLNTAGECDGRSDWLRIDNTDLSVEAVAAQTIAHFGL